MSLGFHVASFAPDGELLDGVQFMDHSRLSTSYIQRCRTVLEIRGTTFRGSCDPDLDHIAMRITTDSGSALLTFYVRDQPAASGMYHVGSDAASEAAASRMFVESLRRLPLVRLASEMSQVDKPFESILSISERPLAVFVTWALPEVSDDEYHQVQQLGLHFTAAFFQLLA